MGIYEKRSPAEIGDLPPAEWKRLDATVRSQQTVLGANAEQMMMLVEGLIVHAGEQVKTTCDRLIGADVVEPYTIDMTLMQALAEALGTVLYRIAPCCEEHINERWRAAHSLVQGRIQFEFDRAEAEGANAVKH